MRENTMEKEESYSTMNGLMYYKTAYALFSLKGR